MAAAASQLGLPRGRLRSPLRDGGQMNQKGKELTKGWTALTDNQETYPIGENRAAEKPEKIGTDVGYHDPSGPLGVLWRLAGVWLGSGISQ